MCKYAKSKGIEVKTQKQKEIIVRMLLESQKQPTGSPASMTGQYDPRLWNFEKSSSGTK